MFPFSIRARTFVFREALCAPFFPFEALKLCRNWKFFPFLFFISCTRSTTTTTAAAAASGALCRCAFVRERREERWVSIVSLFDTCEKRVYVPAPAYYLYFYAEPLGLFFWFGFELRIIDFFRDTNGCVLYIAAGFVECEECVLGKVWRVSRCASCDWKCRWLRFHV